MVAITEGNGAVGRRQDRAQDNLPLRRERREGVEDVDDRRRHVDAPRRRDVLAQFDAREAGQIVDQAAHALGLGVHDAQESLARVGVVAGVSAQGLDEAGERRQRRAQFVAGVGEEVGPRSLAAPDLGFIAQGEQGETVAAGAPIGAGQGGDADPPEPLLNPTRLIERLARLMREQGAFDGRQNLRRPHGGGQGPLGSLDAQQLARGGVGEHEPPVADIGFIDAGDQNDRIDNMLQHEGERRLAPGGGHSRGEDLYDGRRACSRAGFHPHSNRAGGDQEGRNDQGGPDRRLARRRQTDRSAGGDRPQAENGPGRPCARRWGGEWIGHEPLV